MSVDIITFSFGSDENLQNDQYLISRMDDQGWVPISIIADFKRVHFLAILCSNYGGALLLMQVCASLFSISIMYS